MFELHTSLVIVANMEFERHRNPNQLLVRYRNLQLINPTVCQIQKPKSYPFYCWHCWSGTETQSLLTLLLVTGQDRNLQLINPTVGQVYRNRQLINPIVGQVQKPVAYQPYCWSGIQKPVVYQPYCWSGIQKPVAYQPYCWSGQKPVAYQPNCWSGTETGSLSTLLSVRYRNRKLINPTVGQCTETGSLSILLLVGYRNRQLINPLLVRYRNIQRVKLSSLLLILNRNLQISSNQP